MNSKLNSNRAKFIEEYLVDLNATQAAIRAGYTERRAHTNASKLLQNTAIAEEIGKRQKQLWEQLRIDQQRVLEEEACIAFSDIGELFEKDWSLVPPNAIPEAVRRAIASVKITSKVIPQKDGEDIVETKYEYRFWDKGKALQRISRHLGLYEQGNEQKGEGWMRALLKAVSELSRDIPSRRPPAPPTTELLENARIIDYEQYEESTECLSEANSFPSL